MKPTTKSSLVTVFVSCRPLLVLLASCFVAVFLVPTTAFAQSKSTPVDKFAQMEDLLPTPTAYRTASGAPGRNYWQQRSDYDIKVELDDTNQRLSASETITYHNNSPDPLSYLWLQLDQNIWAKDSENLSTQSKYSTQAIKHTLTVYSRYTIPYPYPVAQSINGPVGGMEYPMICFNGPRPLPDGTYSEGTKYGLIRSSFTKSVTTTFP